MLRYTIRRLLQLVLVLLVLSFLLFLWLQIAARRTDLGPARRAQHAGEGR